MMERGPKELSMDEAVIAPPEPDQILAESRCFWREMALMIVSVYLFLVGPGLGR